METNAPASVIELASPGVRALRPYEPGKPMEELERELGISDVIKLASNENPLGPGRCALDSMRQALPGIGRYPDGNGFRLKNILSNIHGVDSSRITLGNGSNDILELIARAFVTPDNEVVFSAHAFAVYPIVTQAVGARAVVIPVTTDDANNPFGHDLQAMQDAVNTRTRVVFIANPNNPTGTWIDAASLRTFLEHIPDHVLVVIDEAYYEYARDMLDASSYPETLAWIEDFPNLVVTRTFSKAHGLAGLRVGYAVTSNEVADLLNRVRQPFNVNSLALVAAEAALGDTGHLDRSLEINRTGMNYLQEGLHQLGVDFIPSAANFLCIDTGRPAAPLYDALLRQGIIVRPVANYDLLNHLRVTIGLPEENRLFLEKFTELVS
jgi:histidinol-phosphate aminotransferase